MDAEIIKMAYATSSPSRIRRVCELLGKPMPYHRSGSRRVTVQIFESDRITRETWDKALSLLED